VLGIFVFIGKETFPLFLGAGVEEQGTVDVESTGRLLAVEEDPHREVLTVVDEAGVRFLRRATGETVGSGPKGLDGSRVVSVDRSPRDGRLALGLADGRVLTATIDYAIRYEEQERVVEPELRQDEVLSLFDGSAVAAVLWRHDGDRRSAVVGLSADGEVVVRIGERSRGLLGGGRLQEGRFDLTPMVGSGGTSLALDGLARHLAVGTADGRVHIFRLGGSTDEPQHLEDFDSGRDGGVSALSFLLGDQSLIVGGGAGSVDVWFQVDRDGRRAFRRIHELDGRGAAVTAIAPSQRDKQFLTGAADGTVALHHTTSKQTFFRVGLGAQPVAALAFAPKADGFLGVAGASGPVRAYALDNPHPEVTFGTLFSKVWYEGYDEPDYVWQSTGGTDEFEPKLSMVPLIFGTMKGTLYALLFALPMAVLAALYTSEFASPKLRSAVKPTVEIMASLPSVILGFLAGLWLAPLLEHYIVGTALMLLIVPLVVLLGAFAWRQLPRDVRLVLPRNTDVALLLLLTLASSAVAVWSGPTVEYALFGTSLPRWLAEETTLRYDQRNSLVIGFAMGFAVIPLIFTICEDALSSVPASLRAASLGLGATRWQTAVKIVLPMALPGVFSAAMIGFGRAVGETMIVLMATGNTPILDWNIFTGMRTISANIAVELPEAPHHGTLYRILFLSGLLLFVVTFALNTLAEGVRQRLREKYRRV
jgi:phosphate transport system permease protein